MPSCHPRPHPRPQPRRQPRPQVRPRRRRLGATLVAGLVAPTALTLGPTGPAVAAPAGDVVFAQGGCAPALHLQRGQAGTVTRAVSTGSISSDGARAAGEHEYSAGHDGAGRVHRNYATFDTSDLGSGFDAGRLVVPLGATCRNEGRPGTLRLWAVDTPAGELDDAGSPDPARFEDLGEGRSYGAVAVEDPEAAVEVPLSGSALEDIGEGRTALVVGGTWREVPAERGEVSITGARSPLSRFGHGGWHRRPVTVSFTCTSTYALDATGCPGPLTVSRSGVREVTRTATDVDGVSGRASLTVKIDREAPRLRLRSDPRGRTFSRVPSLHCVTSDRHSGLRGSCDSVTERVGLRRDGRRVFRFVLTVRDVAGNSRHRQGRFLVR